MSAFTERMDLISRRCPDCLGSGRDRKKKKRRCPVCHGTGYVAWCPKCNRIAHQPGEDASGKLRIPDAQVCKCEEGIIR